MFGLGISEIIVIIIILIIITNPKDYPKIIRTIAQNYQKLNQFKTSLTRELNMLDIEENSQTKNDSVYYKNNNKENFNDTNS